MRVTMKRYNLLAGKIRFAALLTLVVSSACSYSCEELECRSGGWMGLPGARWYDSLRATRDVAAGEVFTADMYRPHGECTRFSPHTHGRIDETTANEFLGKELKEPIEKGSIFSGQHFGREPLIKY